MAEADKKISVHHEAMSPSTSSFLFALFLVTLSIRGGEPFKFLVVSPRFAKSHVNFLGKISDVLIDAGHEVVMLSPVVDDSLGSPGTSRARIIEIPQCQEARMNMDLHRERNLWETPAGIGMFTSMRPFVNAIMAQCNATIHHPGLIENLKTENFDVAYAEGNNFCTFGLFHLLGIEKYAVTHSFSFISGMHYMTNAPSNPSYVPALLSGHFGEEMTFFQRVQNSLSYFFMDWILLPLAFHSYQNFFTCIDDSFPHFEDILSKTSMVFFNGDSLTDFPRPTSHKIIEIGGITTWSDILNTRPRNVLISFGTFAMSHVLPEVYKATIVCVVKKFPNVTFIWKYEKPEHEISLGIGNLVEAVRVPQAALLRDNRLSAFVTHCGQGSVVEANNAGVPLVAIPIAADQIRNAQQVKRNGIGVVLRREDLESNDKLKEAIHEVLYSEKYAKRARRLAEMVAKRPYNPKQASISTNIEVMALQIFARNMEFLSEFGPLRLLDHSGAKLNFFQFFLLDIVAFAVLVSFVSFGIRTFVMYLVFSLPRKMTVLLTR